MAPGPDRRVLLLAVGIPLVALLVVVLVSVSGGGDDPDRTTTSPPPTTTTDASPDDQPAVDEAWNAALADALGPLRDALPTYAARVEAWASGSLDAASLLDTLDEVAPVLEAVDGAVRDVGPHPVDGLAQPLVLDATALYRQAVVAHRAAVGSDDVALGREYDRLGRRLRITADRIFDRARERTAAPVELGEGVQVVLPAEVPDWARLELAPGPPLEPTSGDVPGELPPARQDERATQPEQRWLDGLDALDVPDAGDVREAAGDAEVLASLARRLVDAAEALRTEPVPDGDRGRADRVALGWLVLADAARAAQLEALGGVGTGLSAALVELAAGPELSAGPA